ncbi:MAG: carboxypeptidase-like regulatory domain-containing protein, partial [Bacteroidota bacterium]
MMKHVYIILCLFAFATLANAQDGPTATVTGLVTDALSESPIDLVTIYIKDTNIATETAINGRYSLEVPAETAFTLVFSRLGYKDAEEQFQPMPIQSTRQIDLAMAPEDSDVEVVVRASKMEENGMLREEVGDLR